VTVVVLVTACCMAHAGGAVRRAPGAPEPVARSAVLFIGDGMGPAYVTATRLARVGTAGRLRMDTLPYTALVRTYSADSPVTDSAAAASAMACGQKTVIGVLCEDDTARFGRKDGAKLEPIAVWARKQGLRVGLVTTTTVANATPAAFYANHDDRTAEKEIARQAVTSRFDLILGGGRKLFPEDLRQEAEAKGWMFVETAEALRAVDGLGRHVMGLFADSNVPFQHEIEAARKQAPGQGANRGPASTSPTLLEMTRFAVDSLKRTGQPFFLMVEGGRIDHAGHANWARTLVDETAALDEAIGYALDTLDPKTTLVLVTADHETGGLALNGFPEEKDRFWSFLRHPVDRKADEPYSLMTFSTGPGTGVRSEEPPHGPDDRRPSGISIASAAHTGVDVALYAWGVGADRVHGTLDNTAIYTILKEQLEGKPPGP
jgi:alkaline phosphatase